MSTPPSRFIWTRVPAQQRSNFIDALEEAYAHRGRLPASGSPRYAHELNLPGLRCWPLHCHPWLVFYMEDADHIDVWRVRHGHTIFPPG